MFSLKRRWFWANQTGLSKARGHKKGQKRFWPWAAAAGQNLAGCSRPLSLLPCARALERARTAVHTVLFTCPPHYCAVVHSSARAHSRGRRRERLQGGLLQPASQFLPILPCCPGQKRFWPFLWPMAFQRLVFIAKNHLLFMLNILVYHMSWLALPFSQTLVTKKFPNALY